MFIPAGLCCSQPLSEVFQPSPSDHPFPTVQHLLSFQPSLSPFFPFPFCFFHLLHNRTWSNDMTFHSCSRCRCNFHFCPSLCLSANRTTHHLNFLMCRHHQCFNLFPIVLRAHCYSSLDNCPTLRVNLTWYSDWNCQDQVPVSVLVQCFRCPLVQRRMCCF